MASTSERLTADDLAAMIRDAGGIVPESMIVRELDAAKCLPVSYDTLQRWRNTKHPHGPPYIRVGARAYYDLRALASWLSAADRR